MALKSYPGRTNFGLLPEPEGRAGSFITSVVINGTILALVLVLSFLIKPVIQQHKFENTELIFPTTPPPPPPPVKIKLPALPKIEKPKLPEVKLDAPKIAMPKIKPEPKPVEMEAKVTPLPVVKAPKPQVVLAPQPKAALAAAAMPAQTPQVKPSTAPVHFGETFGVTPNPNATRPATVAAIGNPYGGNAGPAVAPHGVVGSTGLGNGIKSGSSAGIAGHVASAGIPNGTGQATNGSAYGTAKVASAGIPQQTVAATPQMVASAAPSNTQAEVNIPKPLYTDEAKQLKIQGAVVLRVTFFANGQIQVLGVLHGLGHGLDEEAKKAVQQGRVIRPATVNGKPMDSTTNITITFQLA
jgi:TonB family protein